MPACWPHRSLVRLTRAYAKQLISSGQHRHKQSWTILIQKISKISPQSWMSRSGRAFQSILGKPYPTCSYHQCKSRNIGRRPRMRIGVLGAGQLGRMLALAGYPLAKEFVFYDMSGSPSAGLGETIVDREGTYLDDFLSRVDRVTYEFEHLPVEIAEKLAQHKPVHPCPRALQVCQNREAEKTLFGQLGIPTPEWKIADSAASLKAAAEALGCPVVAKSITEGYDGKGQAVLRDPEQAEEAWTAIGHPRVIVEKFVNFKREVSIIAVRGADGGVAVAPIAEKTPAGGIVRSSLAAAPALQPRIQQGAGGYTKALLKGLNSVAVLTLELFETEAGRVANEMAPRVHTSGHWTI